MKILLCHTRYLQRGGEDRSFEEERDLLRSGGHEVVEYLRHNDELREMNSLTAAAATLWNRRAAAEVGELVDRERPDVMHVTNSFPLISPAVCGAARRGGAAVVQALRNYRLLCVGSYLMRDGRPCETCVSRTIGWPAIVHGCYRESRSASAVVAAMQTVHRLAGTWRRHVDAFFTLTEFAKSKFVAAGFPSDRVFVKNNCVAPDPGLGPGGDEIVFAGRLSPEKGIATMLAAWRDDADLPPLTIIGDGPLSPLVAAAAAADARITWTGELPAAGVQPRIARARALLFCSEWYETFGRTIAEAFAAGVPVIASDLGAMRELVDHQRTGWRFPAGNSRELANAVHAAVKCGDAEFARIRTAARREFENRFTPARNYERLIEIYTAAITRRRKSHAGRLLDLAPLTDGGRAIGSRTPAGPAA